MLKKTKANVKHSRRRLLWEAGKHKIKVENNGAVVYVGSSVTVHSPGDSPYCFLFTNCDWIN